MIDPIEKQEKPNNKGLALEQDALYHVYASKSPEWHRNMTHRLLQKVDWHRMPMGAVYAYQIIIAWVANSFPCPLVKRSAAITVANMIGNTASIYGSYMWPSSSGPRYIPGGSATAAIALLVALLAILLRRVQIHKNKRLDESDPFQNALSNPNDLESRATGFRYIL